jgi:hypothetical protein
MRDTVNNIFELERHSESANPAHPLKCTLTVQLLGPYPRLKVFKYLHICIHFSPQAMEICMTLSLTSKGHSWPLRNSFFEKFICGFLSVFNVKYICNCLTLIGRWNCVTLSLTSEVHPRSLLISYLKRSYVFSYHCSMLCVSLSAVVWPLYAIGIAWPWIWPERVTQGHCWPHFERVIYDFLFVFNSRYAIKFCHFPDIRGKAN